MTIEDVKEVQPLGEMVLVQISGMIETDKETGLVTSVKSNTSAANTEAILYKAEIVSVGEEVKDKELIKVGKTTLLNRFAGTHVSVEGDKFYKVTEVTNLMVTMDNADVDVRESNPTEDRLMVGVLKPKNDMNSLVSASDNPYESDVSYVKVLKKGPDCKKGFEVGDVLGVSPNMGEVIKPLGNDPEFKEIRVLYEFDVMLKVKK